MISLATVTSIQPCSSDFLPLDLGTVRGFKTRIHRPDRPGQVFSDASRKLILRGVDGIVSSRLPAGAHGRQRWSPR